MVHIVSLFQVRLVVGLFVLFAGECRYITNNKGFRKMDIFVFRRGCLLFFSGGFVFLAENCDKKMKRTRRIMMMK